MSRRLVVEFTKMDGAGNDFVVIDNRFYAFSAAELSSLALTLCDRHTGIGGDGLLALAAPDGHGPGHAFRMRYYNADGSLGTMCGNGARCIVAYAAMAGVADAEMSFGSDAGDMRARIMKRDVDAFQVEVDMPAVRAYSLDGLPPVTGPGDIVPMGRVWTGTEHVAYEVRGALASFPVTEVGREVRYHPDLQPSGANVNFVERLSARADGVDRARVRTFEKGVEAETRACGTGAVAVAACGQELGWWSGATVEVEMAGGTLTVSLAEPRTVLGAVKLLGPARVAFRGSIEILPDSLLQE